MNKKATYPQRLSFVERLAKKVITRVVSDGLPLDNAVKEAISFAQLSTQQIFHLCSVLEDWGQIFNGDPKNYFHTSTEMGKQFPNSQNGYVVYASVAGKNEKIQQVFKTVTALKKQGFTDQDLLNINGELKEVLSVINEFNTDYKTLVSEYEASKTAPAATPPQKGWVEKGKDWLGQQVDNIMPQPGLAAVPAKSNAKVVISQVVPGENIDENPNTEKATPKNIEGLGNSADLEVPEEEPSLGGEEGGMGDLEVPEEEGLGDASMGGDVNASIKPTPSDLMTRIKQAPKWEVSNVLSMQMAESYLKNIQKDFDSLTNNPNINLSSSPAISEYEKVRAKIEESLNKISEATKGAEKIEEKEGELEQKYESPGDIPTEEMIAGEPIEEEPVAPASPQNKPTLEVPEL